MPADSKRTHYITVLEGYSSEFSEIGQYFQPKDRMNFWTALRDHQTFQTRPNEISSVHGFVENPTQLQDTPIAYQFHESFPSIILNVIGVYRFEMVMEQSTDTIKNNSITGDKNGYISILKILGQLRPTRSRVLCVLVYYELLQPGGRITADRYRQQHIDSNYALMEKQPEWASRKVRPDLLHDNARPTSLNRFRTP